jgi:aspartyl-tRNA synthetase
MVRFATSLSKESILDVEGVVSIPKEPLKATTQQVSHLLDQIVFSGLVGLMNCHFAPSDWQVEIQVRKIYCINRSIATLPINLEDAARSEAEFEKAEQVCLFLCFLSLCRKHSTIVSQQFTFPIYDSYGPVVI